MSTPVRTLVLWFPDWPVTAYSLSLPQPWDPASPVAIIRANTVIACSASARAEGVRRGSRRRDAQAACPSVHLVADDPDRDARFFQPFIAAIEELSPGVQLLRPGLCALRARGPARYYGGEDEAARVLLRMLAQHGAPGVRAGVADGPFTAEHAARAAAADDVRIVAPGDSAAFLSPLPVTSLEDPALADFLARLGVRTLGEFAALDPTRVHDRLSETGARLQTLAAGADSRPVTSRTPPPKLSREISFEPPVEQADQIAFAVRTTADAVIRALAEVSLVCTELRIELHDDRGHIAERIWLHPSCFDAGGIVDRVRWQLQSSWEAAEPLLAGGVCRVRLIPEAVDDAAHHQPGLFGQGTDARLHHALSRVQGILGHEGVLVAAPSGGRLLADRQALIPWGDRAVLARDPHRPWPGRMPDPLPATVFRERRAVRVVGHDGEEIEVDERGALSAEPVMLLVDGSSRQVEGWAGPWALREREWDAENAVRAHRLQLLCGDESAWLVLRDESGWCVEGRYD